MSKIRVLSDQLANQIAAGEVVERPASVAKELVENSIDAGARRIQIEVEGGGRRLLRVADDGEGMTRDDALLAFERHATSKIARAEDLNRIVTLGFRGEALASIASVARVELVTKRDEDTEATRVQIEGGRMRDVKAAAHPRGTTITVRDLFFNVPARRKFLRSEATENFHLANLVTHYALAHPEIAFTLTNNGRESLRATPARDLHERAYQLFGADFLTNLLEVAGGPDVLARVRGYISAPRERRTSRDAQYLFINGRYVRDRLISRALSEGYRAILPQGVYPAALLFLEVPLEEVDVNVHPAKTEVRFRRAPAVADAVREAVRTALASAGYVRSSSVRSSENEERPGNDELRESEAGDVREGSVRTGDEDDGSNQESPEPRARAVLRDSAFVSSTPAEQANIDFSFQPEGVEDLFENLDEPATRAQADAIDPHNPGETDVAPPSSERPNIVAAQTSQATGLSRTSARGEQDAREQFSGQAHVPTDSASLLPPLVSAAGLVREVPLESLNANIRPLGQLEDGFIIATDDEGLLLIDQTHAHERILFDRYRSLEVSRQAESQNLLMPLTFDLTPAQAAAFDAVAAELESYGFGLMRLSGRTVAIKAVPADLPHGEAQSLLSEVLETVEVEKRGAARETIRERISASLACRAAIKAGTQLAPEKMRWLIQRLLLTSSPTTCPHGRPVILRLASRDIIKGFSKG